MIRTYVAGGIVVNPKGKILMVNQNGTSWSFPKGHIEKDETTLKTAKREIFEESGIKNLKLIKKLGTYKRYGRSYNGIGEDKTELKTITLFLFSTDENILSPIDTLIKRAIWLDKNKVAKKLSSPIDSHFFLSIINKVVPDKIF